MGADDNVLGVDFGTSNTAASLRWPDGRVRPVLFDGSPLLPSAVCVDGPAELLSIAGARFTMEFRRVSDTPLPFPS